MSWLLEAVQDSKTGTVSSKRIAMLMGTTAMSASVVILSCAAYMGHQVGVELAAVCAPLAGLCGYSYVNGKVRNEPVPV